MIGGHVTRTSPTPPEEGFLNSVMADTKYSHHTIAITSDNKIKIRR